MKYYAVHRGRVPGVYDTWEECSAQVHQFTKHLHKSFETRDEATYFVKFGTDKPTNIPKITAYFKSTSPKNFEHTGGLSSAYKTPASVLAPFDAKNAHTVTAGH